MMRAIQNNPKQATIASYKGMLKHGNGYKLQTKLDQTLMPEYTKPEY
jgi:hypothetical protein